MTKIQFQLFIQKEEHFPSNAAINQSSLTCTNLSYIRSNNLSQRSRLIPWRPRGRNCGHAPTPSEALLFQHSREENRSYFAEEALTTNRGFSQIQKMKSYIHREKTKYIYYYYNIGEAYT